MDLPISRVNTVLRDRADSTRRVARVLESIGLERSFSARFLCIRSTVLHFFHDKALKLTFLTI